jgi:hypothetical protein
MERIHRQCIALAAYMRQSREKLLAEWRRRVEQDPELTTASSITRSQFTDSIPKVLDAFEQALQADDAIRKALPSTDCTAGNKDMTCVKRCVSGRICTSAFLRNWSLTLNGLRDLRPK